MKLQGELWAPECVIAIADDSDSYAVLREPSDSYVVSHHPSGSCAEVHHNTDSSMYVEVHWLLHIKMQGALWAPRHVLAPAGTSDFSALRLPVR